MWGLPNGYVLGEEAGGAFFGGLRYGDGMLYTKNVGDLKVFWQGPSVGWDFGGEGARTMMLVYNLPAIQAIHQRFGGISGSAYFVGGFGISTALTKRLRHRQRSRCRHSIEPTQSIKPILRQRHQQPTDRPPHRFVMTTSKYSLGTTIVPSPALSMRASRA